MCHYIVLYNDELHEKMLKQLLCNQPHFKLCINFEYLILNDDIIANLVNLSTNDNTNTVETTKNKNAFKYQNSLCLGV